MSRKHLGKGDIAGDARRLRVLIGAAGAPSGSVDHGGLTGLGDDDHSQYMHISAGRTVAAVHTFNPPTPGAPFALGANANGQLIPGLNADLLDGLHLSDIQAEIDSDIAAHAADVDAHHDPVTLGVGSNPVLTLSGQELTLGDVATQAELDAHEADVDAHHPLVSFGGDTSDLFSITGQIINFDPQVANTVLAGPTSGGDADPTMRALVDADIPAAIARDAEVTALLASHEADASAHHAPVTAGDGIDLTGQQVSVDISDLLGNGLVEEASNNIALGTPTSVSATSANSVTASSHAHAVSASSAPGAAASLLKTSAAGLLQLLNFYATQDIRIGGGLYVGSTGTNPDSDDIYFDGNLKSVKAGWPTDVYGLHILTTPLTDTAWDGDDAKSSAQWIAMDTVFGVPTNAKAVLIDLFVNSTVADRFGSVSPSSTDINMLSTKVETADKGNRETGIVPVDSSCRLYFNTNGVSAVELRVWGYLI